ncbi:MAG: ABC transporter permease [Bacteroidia bacterium]|nr:ABC transporter permease [Bacteroidia bacterium]
MKHRFLLPLAEFGYLIWRLAGCLPYAWRDRRRVLYQLDHVGVNSLPLVALIGLFSGALMAWQAAFQFKGMVSLSVLGGQVTRALMMEMGPVLTALVISGRIGASMTAEIGTMKVTEQIDALRTMSIDPVRYLVLPRFMGLSLMMPVLTACAILVSVGGAYLVSAYFLDLSRQVFFGSVQDFFRGSDLAGGLIKSVFFGMTISLIGCYKGFRTTLGASGVGEATIGSFVLSAVCILGGDFFLWIILF